MDAIRACDVRSESSSGHTTVIITWDEYRELCRYRDEYVDLCRDRDILNWLEKDKARADAERGRRARPLRRVVSDLLRCGADLQAEMYAAAQTLRQRAARQPRSGPRAED